MLITTGFLLVPRIFLFIKPRQTLPMGRTHTRAGTLSGPPGCFSFYLPRFNSGTLSLLGSPVCRPGLWNAQVA